MGRFPLVARAQGGLHPHSFVAPDPDLVKHGAELESAVAELPARPAPTSALLLCPLPQVIHGFRPETGPFLRPVRAAEDPDVAFPVVCQGGPRTLARPPPRSRTDPGPAALWRWHRPRCASSPCPPSGPLPPAARDRPRAQLRILVQVFVLFRAQADETSWPVQYIEGQDNPKEAPEGAASRCTGCGPA